VKFAETFRTELVSTFVFASVPIAIVYTFFVVSPTVGARGS
jgi:hypothetical protein